MALKILGLALHHTPFPLHRDSPVQAQRGLGTPIALKQQRSDRKFRFDASVANSRLITEFGMARREALPSFASARTAECSPLNERLSAQYGFEAAYRAN
jgi:hypothetical protein